jgi:hypothetical protein
MPMPRKKSVRKASERFVDLASRLEEYYVAVSEGTDLLPQEVTWACEAAIIKLSAYFELLMLNALVGAINNDTAMLTESTGVPFPKHLTDEVCEYIVTSGRYFDYRGRDGLIKVLKSFVPRDHYLVRIVSKQKYVAALDKVISLRNFAAHESRQSKQRAAELVGNLAASGVWLKKGNHFLELSDRLKELATELGQAAPY